MYVKSYDYRRKFLKPEHWKIEIYTFCCIYLLLEFCTYFECLHPTGIVSLPSERPVKKNPRPTVGFRQWCVWQIWVCIVLCCMKLSLFFTCNRAGDKDPVVFDEPILKEIAERKKKSIAQVRFVVRVIFLSSQRWSMHNIIWSNSDIKYTNNITITNWLNIIIWYHTCKLFSHFNMTVNGYIFLCFFTCRFALGFCCSGTLLSFQRASIHKESKRIST